MLIPSRAALDMLATRAPRAWCKRLLSWEVFSDRLHLFALEGHIAHFRPAHAVLRDAGYNSPPDAEVIACLRADDEELSERICRATAVDPYELVEDYQHAWDEQFRDIPLPFGLVALSAIDWEAGSLSAELFEGMVPSEWLAYPEEIFEPSDRFEDIKISLSGLSFDLAQIEMLVPSAGTPHVEGASVNTPSKRIGRPPKWDWDGALAHIAAVANTPDGLPSGDGAQAKIERLIADYFQSQSGAEPAPSDIRKRASRIMEAQKRRKEHSSDSGHLG